MSAFVIPGIKNFMIHVARGTSEHVKSCHKGRMNKPHTVQNQDTPPQGLVFAISAYLLWGGSFRST